MQPDVVKRLNEAFNRVMAMPAVRDKLLGGGLEPVGGTPEQLTRFIDAEITKWTRIAKDVGAKAEMHALIDDLACKGAGVMLISSEMPEVLGLSRRIAVMRGGRITGEVSGEAATQESLISVMTCVDDTTSVARRANGK